MGIKVHTGESNGHSPGGYYRASAPAVIDVNSEESINKWAKVLNISHKELLEAVENFGPVVRNIRRGLNASEDDAA